MQLRVLTSLFVAFCAAHHATASYSAKELYYSSPYSDRTYAIPASGIYVPPPSYEDVFEYNDVRDRFDPYLAEESRVSDYTSVRNRPDPNFNSFVKVQLPEEAGGDVAVSYVSKCNNSMFMKNVKASTDFQRCFAMSELLVCTGDSLEKNYRLMLGDTLYKHCFHYMNLDSLSVALVKQLHQDKTKVELLCENSVPVTRCQCSNHLIELERKCASESGRQANKLAQLTTNFESCRLVRDALAQDNETGSRANERQTALAAELTNDVKTCREEKEKEQEEHTATGALLQNCTALTQSLQRTQDACGSNLTIARKSLRMCIDNITDTRQKREQVYNECEATRAELEKKLLDSLPHDESNPEPLDIPLTLRKFLKVVLLRGYTQQARLFAINPELHSSSYLSKYGSKQQFTPAVPIVPPRYFLLSICAEHCADLRRKRAPSEALRSTRYTFSDPSALLNTRRYRTATGFSLEVSGTVNVWENEFIVDSEQFHVGMFKTKKAQFFALREEGKNFEFCVCPAYEKDLLAEADEFLENMSQVDKALVTGEFRERKPDDPRAFWQRTQASNDEQTRRKQTQGTTRAGGNGYRSDKPAPNQWHTRQTQDARFRQRTPQIPQMNGQSGSQRQFGNDQQFGSDQQFRNDQQRRNKQQFGSDQQFRNDQQVGSSPQQGNAQQYNAGYQNGLSYSGRQIPPSRQRHNPFQVPWSRI